MNLSSVTIAIILFTAAFLASLLGVTVFTRWSLRRGFLDVPNERSSHTTLTPRGGGLVIVLVCLIGYLIIGLGLGLPIFWGYFIGALLVAGISWLDDLYSLPFWSRLIVHMAAAVVLIWDIGFWSELVLPLVSVDIALGHIFGLGLTLVWVVWLVNAYNFMDGIDGIAALQALISCVAWAVLTSVLNMPSAFLLSGIVACASTGFLIHNWQPAKIFMGDVGSAFLGFTLASMPLLARAETPLNVSILPIVAVLFVWFFVFDTAFTLIRRILGRKRIWEAHREHIYQRLIIEGKDHSTVALAYGLASAFICILVLLAIFLSGIFPWVALLSLFVMTILAIYLGTRKKTLT